VDFENQIYEKKDSPKLSKNANENPTNPDWTEDRFFIGLEGRRD
jgi:hypothetical protein